MNAKKSYCVGRCHEGTETAIFLAGDGDEKLTLAEAKKFASKDCGSYFVFDCTADKYHNPLNGSPTNHRSV